MTATTKNSKSNIALYIKWAITLIIPIIVWCIIPITELCTPTIRLYLAVTLCAILMFVFELMPGALIATLLAISYVLFGIAPLATAISPWSNVLVYQTIAILLIIECIQNTTIIKRLAFKLAGFVSGSYLGLLIGVALSGLVVCILIPSATAAAVNMALAIGLIKALDLKPHEPVAAALMLMSFYSVTECQNFIYSTLGIGMTAACVGAVIPGFSISYSEVIFDNLIFIPLVFVIAFVFSKVFKADKKLNGRDYFYGELTALGKMTVADKKALCVVAVMLILLMTSSITGLDMTVTFACTAIAFFLPFINIGTTKNIRDIDVNMIMLIAGCMSIGVVGNSIGLAPLVSSIATPLLTGANNFVLTFIMWVIGAASNFVMTPSALYMVFSGPLAVICSDLGISPKIVAYVLYHCGNDLIFPYENNIALICYAFGFMSMKQFIKGSAVKMALSLVWLLALGVPFWMLIGLY